MVIGAACAGQLGDLVAAAPLVKELRAAVPGITAARVEATAPYVQADDRKRLFEGLLRSGLE